MRNGTLIVLFLFYAAIPVSATDGQELRDLVKQQGQKIQELESEVNRLRERDRGRLDAEIEAYLESAQGDFPRNETESQPRVRLGGYFSLEFRDDGDGSPMEFDAHRLVPKIQADVAPGITFETEIEIEGGGADVDFLDGNEILVEYAELGFEILEEQLVFKVGLLLIPWGRFNQYHDDPLNDFTDRPLVSRRIGAVAFDQPGIAVEGTLEVASEWFLDYDIALVQGFDDEFSTNGGVRDARQSFRSDNNDNKQVFGRFVLSPPVHFVDVLEIGGSFTVGKHDAAGDLANYGYALEIFVKRGPFQVTGEYMALRIEQPDAAPPSDPRRMDGWLVEIAYHFFPANWRGQHVLFTDESTFTFVVRVEGIDLNHSTSGTTFRDDLTQVSIGFNFRPVERTVFKFSYTFVDTEQAGVGSSADRLTISWASYF